MIITYICLVICTHYSVGRDKIVNVWDIKEGKSKKIIPVFEVHKNIILSIVQFVWLIFCL